MIAPRTRIRISEPAQLGNEAGYVLDALRRNELSGGSYVAKFELLCAQESGTRYAIATSSGTTALHAALLALGLGPGDAVIVPACSYIATANAVRYCGAEPVFCDVEPDTWCLSPARVQEAIAASHRRVVGLLPVHLYGVPADMDALLDVAAGHRLWVLEDAAEAHGARVGNRPVGSLGRAGVFSFYGNKIATCGEGGAVVTDDVEVAATVRRLRGQGQSLSQRYVHDLLGFNYRLTNLQAAVGCAQVERLAEHLLVRRLLGDQYRARIAPAATQAHPDGAADWVFPVLVKRRDEVARDLEAAGVETRPVFPSLPGQPIYRDALAFGAPVADRLAADGLLLPLHANMTLDDVDAVCDALAAATEGVAA